MGRAGRAHARSRRCGLPLPVLTGGVCAFHAFHRTPPSFLPIAQPDHEPLSRAKPLRRRQAAENNKMAANPTGLRPCRITLPPSFLPPCILMESPPGELTGVPGRACREGPWRYEVFAVARHLREERRAVSRSYGPRCRSEGPYRENWPAFPGVCAVRVSGGTRFSLSRATCAIGGVRFRGAARRGAGLKTGVPWPARHQAGSEGRRSRASVR